MEAMAASSSLLGSSRSCMLVKPSALTNSRLASEYWHRTPSFGFQLGMRWRCAWAAAAAEMAVRTVRRVRVTKRRYYIPAMRSNCARWLFFARSSAVMPSISARFQRRKMTKVSSAARTSSAPYLFCFTRRQRASFPKSLRCAF